MSCVQTTVSLQHSAMHSALWTPRTPESGVRAGDRGRGHAERGQPRTSPWPRRPEQAARASLCRGRARGQRGMGLSVPTCAVGNLPRIYRVSKDHLLHSPRSRTHPSGSSPLPTCRTLSAHRAREGYPLVTDA